MSRPSEQFPAITTIIEDFAPGLYDFYRCYKCARVITREQEREWAKRVNELEEDQVGFCQCGSLKIYPLRKPIRLEWLQPHVLGYTLKLILARGLAPWCDRNFPAALPYIEYLVSPKEATDG